MSRLIAFGCSYTYGEGLDDCWTGEEHGPNPSKLAWPSLIADKLNLEVYNHGKPGTSNKHIWYEILNYDFHRDDTVIILWTHFNRSCVIRDDGTTKRLLPGDTAIKPSRFTKNYYLEYWTATDALLDSFNRINYIDYYLKSKGIAVYHFTVEIDYKIPSWSKANLISVPFFWHRLDRALDGVHPGIKSHKKMVKTMLKHIAGDNIERTIIDT